MNDLFHKKMERGADTLRKARVMDPELKRKMKEMGLRIAYQRKRRGLTQEELAEKVDYSLSYLSRIEASGLNDNVMPTFEFVYKVVAALEISIHDLVGD